MADLPQNSIKLEGARKPLEGPLWFPTVMNSNLKHIYLYYRLGDINFKKKHVTGNSQKKLFPVMKDID